MKEVKVMYHNADMEKLKNIGGVDHSVMVDLYTSEDIKIEAGKSCKISLGVSIKLPENTQGNIVPRSSTFKKYGLLQTNSYGVIDTSYCGKDDIWNLEVFAPITQEDIIKAFHQFKIGMEKLIFRAIEIPKHTRLCQFEIKPNFMNEFEFIESDLSNEKNRGGFGSTGL